MIMPRRLFEVVAAIYCGVYGLWIETVIKATDYEPLWWTGQDEAGQRTVAWLMISAALLHGIGLRVNGQWQYSPVLRAIGMAMSFGIMLWLGSNVSSPWSTATYTYTFIGSLVFIGLVSAISDARTALLRRFVWTPSLKS